MCRLLIAIVVLLTTAGFDVGPTYRQPSKDIVDIIDAPTPPVTMIAPSRDRMLVVTTENNPPITALAAPVLRLAGIKIDPATGLRQRLGAVRSIAVQALDGSPPRPIALPAGARLGVPVWSSDGRRFAFTRETAKGAELWVGDAATATARAFPNLRLSDVLGGPFAWLGDNRRMIVRTVERGRKPPPPTPRAPAGPNIEEVQGKKVQAPTYQELLKTPHDAALLTHYAMSQLVILDVTAGMVQPFGAPGLLGAVDESPDGKYVRVTRVTTPFSFTVPVSSFARSVEIWDARGAKLAVVAELPVADEVPRQGVPTGPRGIQWQQLAPATLVWTEALDGGDPVKKVEHREKLMTLSAPFAESPRELLRLKHRFSGFDWMAKLNTALVSEYDRDRRWTTTRLVDFANTSAAKTIFDRSANDDYADPGTPVYDRRAKGETTVLQDGDWIYLAGSGATAAGDRPFLDKLNLVTLEKMRLFQADSVNYERFGGFTNKGRSHVLTYRESATEPRNLFLTDLESKQRRALTANKDPAPVLRTLKRELVTYKRADGTPMSGTLYLPPGYTSGTRLPAFVWAYPQEFSDATTAGQVRSAPNRFTRPSDTSPVFLALKGYAVLMDATMPVVGDPETVNNTFIEQITANARAAIDKLDEMGVADKKRVIVGGHSYGAFMTANLLAHTDLFVAGIARSGAYNRTLTPFGFQGERRSYWEATDVYTRMSPFTFANKINEPLLLIHGEADNNPGTFPIQSERLFAAIRGNGGTARYVTLPHEQHGYAARESVLHVMAEMIDWADRWTGVKK